MDISLDQQHYATHVRPKKAVLNYGPVAVGGSTRGVDSFPCNPKELETGAECNWLSGLNTFGSGCILPRQSSMTSKKKRNTGRGSDE
jgi:hypothetical protein